MGEEGFDSVGIGSVERSEFVRKSASITSTEGEKMRRGNGTMRREERMGKS